jgi:hypothetical protein
MLVGLLQRHVQQKISQQQQKICDKLMTNTKDMTSVCSVCKRGPVQRHVQQKISQHKQQKIYIINLLVEAHHTSDKLMA